ncbi:MAG TPA: hypothetical protein PK286_13970 [Devosia sp.]|nr:hypothetical protein [Devosia sp.]
MPLPIAASPSRLWLVPVAAVALLLAVICLIPMLVMLAGMLGIGGLRTDFGATLVAFPVAGVAAFLLAAGFAAFGDLMMPRPVLTIDEHGLFDRRITDTPIRWDEVATATALPRGSVVLDLKSARGGRLNPYRVGSVFYQRPDDGVVVIPVRAMDMPAADLADAILLWAEQHGASVGTAARHEKLQPLRFF